MLNHTHFRKIIQTLAAEIKNAILNSGNSIYELNLGFPRFQRKYLNGKQMETPIYNNRSKQLINQHERKEKPSADIKNIKIRNNIFFQSVNKKILSSILNYFVEIKRANYKTIKEIFRLKNTRDFPKIPFRILSTQ
jgi:hypothetical protein